MNTKHSGFSLMIGNQYLYNKDLKRKQKKHHQNIRSARTVLSTKLCSEPPTLSQGKRAQNALERNCQIEHDNLLLVEKMRVILSRRQMDNIQTTLPKSLNRRARQQELTQQVLQNEWFFQRLVNNRGCLNRKKWEDAFKKSREYKKMRSRYNNPLLYPKKPKRPATANARSFQRRPGVPVPLNERPPWRDGSTTRAPTLANNKPLQPQPPQLPHSPRKVVPEEKWKPYLTPRSGSGSAKRSPTTQRFADNAGYVEKVSYENFPGFCSSDEPKFFPSGTISATQKNSSPKPTISSPECVEKKSSSKSKPVDSQAKVKLYEGTVSITGRFTLLRVYEKTNPHRLDFKALDPLSNLEYLLSIPVQHISLAFQDKPHLLQPEKRRHLIAVLCSYLLYANSQEDDSSLELCIDISNRVSSLQNQNDNSGELQQAQEQQKDKDGAATKAQTSDGTVDSKWEFEAKITMQAQKLRQAAQFMEAVKDQQTAPQPPPPTVSTSDWFYGDKSQKTQGPHNQTDLIQLWQDGVIDRSTFFFRQGMTDWLQIENIPELLAELDLTSTLDAEAEEEAELAEANVKSVEEVGVVAEVSEVGEDLDFEY
eukprot:CAMPEP_0175146574 /NCGR_PEP_ID=MMETSP0087-20121206/15456_1 /TAXON_ID=136419 /ORGANISM="Unknown Unknown, Strain D1" /LENGTH=593 /DNA_ID=CAMNT_0016431555 /DNA_START=17 /DNA_END=1798 /DNA_ORIENTATION=-